MALPSAGEIEPATLSAWPALQVAYDGLWIWRGGTRLHQAGQLDPLSRSPAMARMPMSRLAAMIALSRRHELPPVFRVTPLTAPEAIAALERLDWVRFDEAWCSRWTCLPRTGAVGWRTEQFEATRSGVVPAAGGNERLLRQSSVDALAAILGVITPRCARYPCL